MGLALAWRISWGDGMGFFKDDSVHDCPTVIPDSLFAWIRQEVLPKDKVLLYKKGGMRGVCYACGKSVKCDYPFESRFAQYQQRTCPECGEQVTAWLDGGCHFKSDYVANVCLCQVRGETVWFRFFHILREAPRFILLSKNLREQEFARHAIHGKECAKWVWEYKWGMGANRGNYADWYRKRDVHDIYDGDYHFYIAPEDAEAIRGTSLRYERLDDYAGWVSEHVNSYRPNPVLYLQDFAKFGIIEKLWNAGYKRLVFEKVRGLQKENRNAILWQRPQLKEAFRFPMRFLREHEPEEWTMNQVERMWKCYTWGSVWGYNAGEILDLYRSTLPISAFQTVLGHGSVGKVLRFWTDVLHERDLHIWTDHIRMSREMGRNLDDKSVFFPAKLVEEHQRLIEIRREAERAEHRRQREALRDKMSVPFPNLDALGKKFGFTADGLVIRPANNAFELVEEGDELHHCVSGYAKQMETGKTVILFIRKADTPDTPFFTLEFLRGRVEQCRTKFNKSYEDFPAIAAFVQKWLAAKKLVGSKVA